MFRVLKRFGFLMVLAGWLGGEGVAVETPSAVISLPEVRFGEELNSIAESEEISIDYRPERFSFSGLAESASVVLSPSVTSSSPPIFSIRGMDPSQTRVFIEGVPLTEPVFQSDNLSLIPKLAIQKVDLFNETAPASFLSSSLGGAINLRLQDLILRPKVLGQVGNLGSLRVAGQSQLAFGWSLDLEYEQAKENFEYWNDNATPFNSTDDEIKERVHNSFKRVLILPSFRVQEKRQSSFHFFSLNSFQVADVPGPTHRPNPYELADWNNLTVLRGKTPLAEHLTGDGMLFFRARADELTKENETETEPEPSLNYTSGAKASVNWKQDYWKAEFAAGFNFSKYRSKIEVERFELPASLSAQILLGSSFELKPAMLIALSDSKWNASPRLGFDYRPWSSLRLFGFGGWVFRQPSLSELVGNQVGVAANQELKEEMATKAELGFQWFPWLQSSLAKSHVSFSVFGAKAQNLILFSQVGPDLRRAENIGKASWLGQELSFRIENPWGFFSRPSFLWLWTRNESPLAAENGKSLPYRFPMTLLLETGIERDKWNAGHRASFFSPSFTDKMNQEQLAAYQLHDLYLGLKVKEWGLVQLSLQNLFNITLASASMAGVEVSKSVSGINGYPTAGRRIGVTWVYDF
ncbi:MAG: TonB-dependent receptor domain-containing protein [Pseudomonadota bacterium]